jgi:Zn-dependent peptidase ImmA (M78 family)
MYYGTYKNVRNAAWQVLIDNHITTLPLDITQVIHHYDIILRKNSLVHLLSESESGKTVVKDDIWVIVYDDALEHDHKRFTVSHELGHILLGHPLTPDKSIRTFDRSKPRVESEADMFASRLLAPACVLKELGVGTIEDIIQLSKVSYPVAKERLKRLQLLRERDKFYSDPLEKKLYTQFESFIEKKKL